ncbi:hypothetical protein [Ktedonobacter racemifer]|uniref:Uncharacterized protein n=1 Tax=Ktedonobacter racemifer DSM 44963 TaxID=485913 RepID=D6TH56_KTERA|nr:hypothetical protein [Ktedonobacter racemifer]EFH90798.1 hypothetical protein Krac_12437 [Ktedonobacter racemifer DSM 44963]
MAILSAIKSGIGKFNPFAKQGSYPSTNVSGGSTIQRQDSEKIVEGEVVMSYSEMGPEEIQRRNYAILAEVTHDAPAHDRILDIIKEIWRIVGPLAKSSTTWRTSYPSAKSKTSGTRCFYGASRS